MVFLQRAREYVLFDCNIQGLTGICGFWCRKNGRRRGTTFTHSVFCTETTQSGIPDIPHRGSIIRFCESDTIALEKAYRYGME